MANRFRVNQIVVTTTKLEDSCSARELPKNSPVKIGYQSAWGRYRIIDSTHRGWNAWDNELDIASPKEKAEYRNLIKQ